MTNIYEPNDLVDFCDQHGITIRQFLYCILLDYDKRHSRIKGSHKISRPLSKIYKYHQNVENFTKAEIQDLIDKKLVKKDGEKYAPDMLEVTQKFLRSWYGQKTLMLEELIEEYPSYITNFDHPGKPKIPINTVGDYEKTKQTYHAFVKTYKMHNRVLDLVKWGRETDNIKLSLQKFVQSRFWENLAELRDENASEDVTYTNI